MLYLLTGTHLSSELQLFVHVSSSVLHSEQHVKGTQFFSALQFFVQVLSSSPHSVQHGSLVSSVASSEESDPENILEKKSLTLSTVEGSSESLSASESVESVEVGVLSELSLSFEVV